MQQEAQTALDILIKGRELISDEKRWTKGAFALTAKGNVIGADCLGAVCFCSVGAIQHFKPPVSVYSEALAALHDAMGINVTAFNDLSNHEHVLAAWDRAIEAKRASA